MNFKKLRILTLLVFSLLLFSCVYIEVPDDIVFPDKNGAGSKTWNAIVTNIQNSDSGKVHIDITIQNETDGWSKLESVPGKPAVIKTSDGKTTNCATVFVSTGGHRLAPGFQMRGYTTGKKDAPETQLLYVECDGVTLTDGASLSINYISYSGDLDDYSPDANKTSGVLEISLDDVVTDLSYPIDTLVDGLIRNPDNSILALSDNVVTLLNVERTENGFKFLWQNFNPSKFPLKTHIGTPPVIGENGIIYGVYQTMDIVDVPITPPQENAEWSTEVSVPQKEKGFYILLSVESKKPRTYVNYAINISEK